MVDNHSQEETRTYLLTLTFTGAKSDSADTFRTRRPVGVLEPAAAP